MTKQIIILLVALFMGATTAFGQGKASKEDTVFYDKSFLEAGTPTEPAEFHLVPKFYKAGDLAPEQPIALTRAKKEAMELAKEKPCPFRKDCLNMIYTLDPIYNDEGSIYGAIKGTILIKWEDKTKTWKFSYIKYQLVNIDQNAIVFKLEAD
jgi:hypothetical protein